MTHRKAPPVAQKHATDWRGPALICAGFLISGLAAALWVALRIQPRPPEEPPAPLTRAEPHATPVRGAAGRLTHPILTCTTKPSGDNPLGSLEKNVRTLLDRAPSSGVKRAAVHVADLETCESFELGPSERFHPASMMKLVPALAWLRRAEQDGQVLKQRLVDNLPPDMETKDIKNLSSALVSGQSYEVADLLRRMLVDSRNDALLLLKRDQTPEERDAIWTDLGVPAPAQEGNIELRVHDIALVFQALYDGAWMGREMSERMLGWLADASFREGLTAQLPAGALVAHKFGRRVRSDAPRGEWTVQLHDCGILYQPVHPMLVCVMTEGVNEAAQQGVIQQIAALAWNWAPAQPSNPEAAAR